MLAGSVEFAVFSLGMTQCCCCFDHSLGVAFMGVIYVIISVLLLSGSVIWSYAFREACYGPFVIQYGQRCFNNLQGSGQFENELRTISRFLNVN